jgi:hypothetical protein
LLTLGSLAFAAPWVLTGLVVLPLIWLLLRVTPPAPRLQRFPAIRLLFGLRQREETPARTPWWLILLRMALAAAVILGLAHPLLNPGGKLAGAGPLVLVIDDGWAAARVWRERQRDAVDLLDVAERDGRPVVLVTTARQPGGETPVAVGPQRPAEIRARVQALVPKPWPVDREAARQAIEKLPLSGSAQAIYYADGLDDPAVTALATALQRVGALRVVTAAPQDLPILLLPPENRTGEVDVVAKRIPVDQPGLAVVRALAADGRLLARETLHFEPHAGQTTASLKLPLELRNDLARIEIEGQEQTGAVVLLDDRWQRRPVGVVSSTPLEGGQSLLEDTYYLERALGPFAEIRRGTIADLLRSQLAVLLLADDAPLAEPDRAALKGFIDKGGVVVRFAGPRLADGKPDDLVPVRLRPGGRELGTALQWTQPAHLAPFRPNSPFAGLSVPSEVTISRQVLAEPALDLPEKSWAQLADGTPLVTADKRGAGWLVLFHVPANAEWSNLPLSGLFVEMLRRVVQLSRGIAGGAGNQPLPPIETLDGFGRLQAAPASATALLPEAAQNGVWRVDPRHPPGFYGADQQRQAVNLTATVTDIAPLRALPDGVQRGQLETAGEVDLRAWLLTAALALALVDLFIALALRGLLLGRAQRVASITLLALLLGAGAAQAQAQNQEPRGASDEFALKATLETRLVYVRTGNDEVDEISRAGLRGLTSLLNRRTAIEAAEPMAVDVETDELAFFPLLYWPVVSAQRPLSPAAIERLNTYLHTGGTILFDTRDQGEVSVDPRNGPGTRRLQQLVRGLEIPPLAPVPPDHVLTKAFYLMQDFPGRYAGGTLWVESHEGASDEVSSVIIGSNDYAGAWAIDNTNRPMFAVVPGGERQREFAFRFGVNLVMYALTGNYKTDQVHVPSILERLGQ